MRSIENAPASEALLVRGTLDWYVKCRSDYMNQNCCGYSAFFTQNLGSRRQAYDTADFVAKCRNLTLVLRTKRCAICYDGAFKINVTIRTDAVVAAHELFFSAKLFRFAF